jgi:uncharacterized protein YkwD
MALGWQKLAVGLILGSTLLSGVLAASPAAPNASAADACSRWGDARPKHLSAPHARKAIKCLINKKRGRAGLPGLKSNKKLQKAARRHSQKMTGSGCFAHQCPGEGDLGIRLQSVGWLIGGLTKWLYGENLAWGRGGHGTPRAIVKAWMHAPGHRANVLQVAFRELGVGFAHGSPHSSGGSAGMYTVDFGLRVG